MAKPQINEANSAPWSCAKHRVVFFFQLSNSFFFFFQLSNSPAYKPSTNLANSRNQQEAQYMRLKKKKK